MTKPYLNKLEEEFSTYEKVILEILNSQNEEAKHPLSKKEVIERAIVNEKYDIYHSTTIEGYHITPQEVEDLIYGNPDIKTLSNDIKNKMAVMGHKQASEFIISKIETDFGVPAITQDLISEMYFQLFKPSVDASIINKLDLMGYRRCPIYLKGSRYVPPAYGKINDLMDVFFDKINIISHPFIKAILAHYFFVTIHPYPDGNGRCARLLMNYVLACSAHSWATITVDKRDFYFSALQKGQIDNDITPFAEFILNLF
ncbi:MAG: Fic family protein [bacterium]